jgi:hypothetical protein
VVISTYEAFIILQKAAQSQEKLKTVFDILGLCLVKFSQKGYLGAWWAPYRECPFNRLNRPQFRLSVPAYGWSVLFPWFRDSVIGA